MASYYATARTNYFRISSLLHAKLFATKWGMELNESLEHPDLYCLISEGEEGWPSEPVEADDDDEEDDQLSPEEWLDSDDEAQTNIAAEMMAFVAKDEIVVVMETGSEKARYLIGYATAYCNDETLEVSINDIYAMAEAKWGKKPTPAQY